LIIQIFLAKVKSKILIILFLYNSALETSERHTSIEDHYFIFTDNYGGDRSLDTADGNPIWQTLYLDGLQFLYDYDVN